MSDENFLKLQKITTRFDNDYNFLFINGGDVYLTEAHELV